MKRAYEEPDRSDGTRLLVDRLWPRGLSRVRAAVDEWLRDVAPSDGLRRWYGHDAARFGEFARRYREELGDAEHLDAVNRLRAYTSAGPVTLVTATRDLPHSHAVVLAELVETGPLSD